MTFKFSEHSIDHVQEELSISLVVPLKDEEGPNHRGVSLFLKKRWATFSSSEDEVTKHNTLDAGGDHQHGLHYVDAAGRLLAEVGGIPKRQYDKLNKETVYGCNSSFAVTFDMYRRKGGRKCGTASACTAEEFLTDWCAGALQVEADGGPSAAFRMDRQEEPFASAMEDGTSPSTLAPVSGLRFAVSLCAPGGETTRAWKLAPSFTSPSWTTAQSQRGRT